MENKYFKGIYKNTRLHPNPEDKDIINRLCHQKGIQNESNNKGFYEEYYYYIRDGTLQYSEIILHHNWELVDFKYFLDWLEDNIEPQYEIY